MYETDEDLAALRKLLDDSYASAGPHLLSIHTPNWRMSVEEIIDKLQGMCVLDLATVSSRGEPVIGPVDGMFFRGRFWFGSSPDSVRAKHIKKRPAVSVAHTKGEEYAIVAHGTAVELTDKTTELAVGFRGYATETYNEEMIDSYWHTALYWWLDARKMFAIAPRVELGTPAPTA